MKAQAHADYAELSDRDLASAFARGEAGAIRYVTAQNNRRLFRAAWSILRNKAEAEDAVQEAYVLAFGAIASFHAGAALSTWLTRIVINEALGRKRAATRRAAAMAANSVALLDAYREERMHAHASPEGDLMRKQLADLLERAVARLPDPFRVVFVLREIEGMSIAETAAALAIAEETVKTRTHRARLRLLRMLDPELRGALGRTVDFAGADCERLTRTVLQRLGHESSTTGEDA
jgi:RNA polymerase sigma-70 factor (ECF subfamily)